MPKVPVLPFILIIVSEMCSWGNNLNYGEMFYEILDGIIQGPGVTDWALKIHLSPSVSRCLIGHLFGSGPATSCASALLVEPRLQWVGVQRALCPSRQLTEQCSRFSSRLIFRMTSLTVTTTLGGIANTTSISQMGEWVPQMEGLY